MKVIIYILVIFQFQQNNVRVRVCLKLAENNFSKNIYIHFHLDGNTDHSSLSLQIVGRSCSLQNFSSPPQYKHISLRFHYCFRFLLNSCAHLVVTTDMLYHSSFSLPEWKPVSIDLKRRMKEDGSCWLNCQNHYHQNACVNN